MPDSVDLYLIISKMCEDKLPDLGKKSCKKVSLTLFNMIGFINFTLANKFSALQRKALSVRDIINCVQFMQVGLPLFSDKGDK